MTYIKFSIIIPAYNRERTIEYCLRSILSQSYADFEIIVVDDCSTDNTCAIVEGMQDCRIRLIRQTVNAGAQAARNRGIKASRGQWIAFQDSDDTWEPDKLEKQFAILQKYNFSEDIFIYTDAYRTYPPKWGKKLWNLPSIVGKKPYMRMLENPAPLFPSMLISKTSLIAIGYLDENVASYQEWDTSIRLAKICTFIHIQEPLFTYYLHEDITISKDTLRDFLGYQFIIEKHMNDIIEYCGEKTFQDHLKNQFSRFYTLGLNKTDWQLHTEILNFFSLLFQHCRHEDLLFRSEPSFKACASIMQKKIFRRLFR